MAVQLTTPKILFNNRQDAGRQLAAELSIYKDHSAIVLAIPNGGVPVGIRIASELNAELEVVVARKVPLPLNPEAGFGAVTDDGTLVLIDEMVKRYGLTREQIDFETSKVRENVKLRSLKYKGNRLLGRINGRTAIIVDDGMASGITMAAAVESLRHRRPKEIVVAVPVAPVGALERVRHVADRVVTCAVVSMTKFYISDFFKHKRNLSDDEVVRALEEWRNRNLP
jgi:putative phosphoribosyl transferase